MQVQAPVFSGNAASQRLSRELARRFELALIAFVSGALLATTAGCGSGLVATSQPQSTPAPVASALGPQLGYLWVNADHTLRPILGVAGSSLVGQSLVSAGEYIAAATSATQGVAILQATDGSFDLMTLPSGSPVSLVGLTLPAGAQLRLSPAASAALLYTPGASSASLVTGLPSTPKLQTISVGGPIVDSAVSDTGTASFEYSQSSSVTLAVVPLGGRSVSVATVGSGGGLNFLPGRDDLLYADAAANTLTLLRSATSAPSATLIQTSGLLKTPAAVGVSGSGRWALVANSASQSLVRVDLNSLAAVSVACTCTPTLAATLADDGAFRVTDAATGPNWLVDASSPTPRTLFIPALPASAKSSLIASMVVP
jgi:hypothetical protein